MRTFAGCTLMLVLAVSATAVAQEKGKADGKLLLGKWLPTEIKKGEPPMTIEFLKDGKMAVTVDIAGKPEKLDGTYKLDGDKLDVALKFGGDEKKDSLKINKLTDTTLETTDTAGKVDTFARVKEEKKPEEKKPAEKKPAEKKPEEKKKP